MYILYNKTDAEVQMQRSQDSINVHFLGDLDHKECHVRCESTWIYDPSVTIVPSPLFILRDDFRGSPVAVALPQLSTSSPPDQTSIRPVEVRIVWYEILLIRRPLPLWNSSLVGLQGSATFRGPLALRVNRIATPKITS